MKEILKLGVCINDLSISAPEIVFTVWATNTCEHEVQWFLGQQWKLIHGGAGSSKPYNICLTYNLLGNTQMLIMMYKAIVG